MDLIVVRHAIAQERRAGLPDARRALTARGRARMRLAVAGLRRLGVRLDHVHHSPLRRAVQTARLLAPLLRDRGASSECAELAREPSLALLAIVRADLHGGTHGGLHAELHAGSGDELHRVLPDELHAELRGDLHAELRSDCVALVGHEPWTGELVSWLVLGTPQAAAGFALRKGGVAWLRGQPEPGGMRIVALLTPRVLRGLGSE